VLATVCIWRRSGRWILRRFPPFKPVKEACDAVIALCKLLSDSLAFFSRLGAGHQTLRHTPGEAHLKCGYIRWRLQQVHGSSMRLDYRAYEAQAEPDAVSGLAADARAMKEPLKDSLPLRWQRT
jgi:hypothetical protein